MYRTTRTGGRGDKIEVEWEIPDFLLSLRGRVNEWLDSSVFPFADHKWWFQITAWKGEMKGIFPILICRDGCRTECSAVLEIGFKNKDGQVDDMKQSSNLTFLKGEPIKFVEFPHLSRDVLEQRGSELLPSGVLTLVITLRKGDPTTDVTTMCIEKLSDDLKDLMLSAEESDFTVKVKGEEFRLHRNILGARTPVFRSMLRSEMEEKRTGCVCIDDCEPETFRKFVLYVYTGRVDQLSTDAVFELYALADKYQVEDLKAACLVYIQGTVSVHTFCDVVNLSLTYDLKDLLERATRYFSQNTVAIIQTVKWMDFMKGNHIQANELYLKALLKK